LFVGAVYMVIVLISGFRREVDETFAILRYYAASSGNSLQAFRDNLSVPLNLEDGADRLSLNVGKELPLLAAYLTRRAQFP